MKPVSMTRRELLRASAFGAAAALLAACQAPSPAEPASPTSAPATEPTKAPATAAPAQKVKLEYWDMAWGDKLMGAIQENVKAFNDSHPNIEVKYTELAWGDYNQKFQSAIASGNPPDVAGGGGSTPFAMYAQGEVLDLSELYTKWKGDGRIDAMTDWGKTKWLYEGKYLAATWQLDARGIFYRKDLFEKAGIPLPTNHDELLEAAKKLTDRKNEQYGIVFPGKTGTSDTDQWFVTLLQQNGGVIADEKGNPAFNSPEALATLQFEKELMDAAAPEGTPSYAFTEAGRLYMQGNAAMIFQGGWFISQLKEQAPEIFKNTGILPALKGRGDKAQQVSLGFYNGWFIFRQSKHPKEAMEFLDFLSAPENLMKVYAADLGNKYSPYKSLADDPIWQQEPLVAELNKQVAEHGVDYYFPYNSNPIGIASLGRTMSDTIINPVLAGGLSPKDALAEGQAKAEPGFAQKQ